MTPSVRLGLAAACTLLAAARVAGQSPLCGNHDAVAQAASAAPLQAARPADGTSYFDMTSQGPHDAAAKALGSMTVTQNTITCGAARIVERVIVYDYGSAGKVVDTTLSDASTLAPIMERTRKSSGDIVLDFSLGLVRGNMTRNGVTRRISDTLPALAFNSTDLELIVRSLALREGFSVALEIYDPEYGGFRPDSIRVVKLEPPQEGGSEGAWIVHSQDRRLESTYRIAERSRQLLSIDVRADSTQYHIVRVPRAA